LGGRGRWISEFKASLFYRVNSRTARVTQRNPVSEKDKKNKQKKKNKKQKQKKTKSIIDKCRSSRQEMAFEFCGSMCQNRFLG
jgi:Zn-dependent peptidase ImmA (M78 family)